MAIMIYLRANLSEEICKLFIIGCFTDSFSTSTFGGFDHHRVTNFPGHLKRKFVGWRSILKHVTKSDNVKNQDKLDQKSKEEWL